MNGSRKRRLKDEIPESRKRSPMSGKLQFPQVVCEVHSNPDPNPTVEKRAADSQTGSKKVTEESSFENVSKSIILNNTPCSSGVPKRSTNLPSLGMTRRIKIPKKTTFSPIVETINFDSMQEEKKEMKSSKEEPIDQKTEALVSEKSKKRFRLGLRAPPLSDNEKAQNYKDFVRLKQVNDDHPNPSVTPICTNNPEPIIPTQVTCLSDESVQTYTADENNFKEDREESPDEIPLSPIAMRPNTFHFGMQSRHKRYLKRKTSDDGSGKDMFSDTEEPFNGGEEKFDHKLEADESSYQSAEDFEESGIKSFYAFQTFINQTASSSFQSQSQNDFPNFNKTHEFPRKHSDKEPTACFTSILPCPSRVEVSDSMKKFRMFEMREREELRHGVFVSKREDLKCTKLKTVDVGRERLKLSWERDLPPFDSHFYQKYTLSKNFSSTSGKSSLVTYTCVAGPPTYLEIEKMVESKETKPPVETNEKSEVTKLPRKGLRKNSGNESEDSIVSISDSDKSSCSDPFSDVLQPTQDTSEASLPEKRVCNKSDMHKSSSRIISCDTSVSNPQGFKTNFKNLKSSKGSIEPQYLKLMSVEVHVVTRCRFLPDPEFDPLTAIFYVFSSDEGCENVCKKTGIPTKNGSCLNEGVFILNDKVENENCLLKRDLLSRTGISELNVTYFSDEKELILKFADLVIYEDPDIIIGYEVQQSSWGFIVKRASIKYDINYPPMISRCSNCETESKIISSEKSTNFVTDPDTELVIVGRIVLNLWKQMRSEVNLTSYTAENMFFHVLHERVPKYDHQTLTKWWTSSNPDLSRWRVMDYYLVRTHGNLRLIDQLDFIGRTGELAKLFGIQFHEVLSRGSQFRVESIMLRLVKARKFIPVSPSIQQRAKMRAPEYLPLVMEPESRFYSDPVVVLDFQSLYPSIIMAYNYCYSTCIGRVVNQMEDMISKLDITSMPTYKFGCTQLMISLKRLAKLDGHLNFSPGGIAFLKPYLREGILPKMLEEILDTRQMVKRSMKMYNQEAKKNPNVELENDSLQKILHSRQLGLKLIANVTYGYTSANFSGRMPCIEVGDSVVSKGRETLERAIHFIENASGLREKSPQSQGSSSHSDQSSLKSWEGARVVYGDTDSLFVLLPGRTKKEAFTIGQHMADEITKQNPKPIKLKFEKVYQPCILQTKKRYVGYMYETPDQEKPVYEAKGIETVRRDGVPSVVKMLEKSLRILFETKDVSLVKRYVQNQFTKISSGKIPLQDLTFAREFRGMAGYRATACVPALELAKRLSRIDRMSVPPQSYRVPYVIIFGEPGRPLFHSVRTPQEVLEAQYPKNDGVGLLRPNTEYYITKVIVPALDRCFSLIGADVMKWYLDLPKVQPRSLLLMDDNYSVVSTRSLVSHSNNAGFRSRGRPRVGNNFGGRQGVILQYFSSSQCIVCDKTFPMAQKKSDKKSERGCGQICSECLEQPQRVALSLTRKLKACDKAYDQLSRLCSSCAGGRFHTHCVSYDCPLLYQRTLAEAEAQQVPVLAHILTTLSIS